jgi:hypothetical protein
MRLPQCGARTRAGGRCKRSVCLGKTRCPNHGGAPGSGIRTPEGVKRSAEAVRAYWARRREERKLADLIARDNDRNVAEQIRAGGDAPTV